MNDNRTFAVMAFGAMGLYVGHCLAGLDWACAACLAVAFSGVVRGIFGNRREDIALYAVMILLFPVLTTAFPAIWSKVVPVISRNGTELDVTERVVLPALLFVAAYAVTHLFTRLFLSSVMTDGPMTEASNRTAVHVTVLVAYFFVAILGTAVVCKIAGCWMVMKPAHYALAGTVACVWLLLALRRLWRQLRKQAERQLNDAAPRKNVPSPSVEISRRPLTTFADVAGMDEAKRQIRLRLIDPIRDRARAQRYGIKPGGGVLLYGPPGTGKTLLARAVAGELKLPFFSITAADIFGKLVGDSEKNVRRLFKEIRRHALSVVFIDELETIFPNRSVDVHETTRKVVAYMLQELDGVEADKNPFLLLGATNIPWMVDEAFLRPGRFDVKIFVGLPDEETRKKVIDMLFARGSVRPVPGLAEYIAKRTDRFSGADLSGLVDGIRQLAYDRHLPLYTHALADEVLENVFPSATGSILNSIREWELGQGMASQR